MAEDLFISSQKVYFRFLDRLWSKFNPTVGQLIAAGLIFLAGISMKGTWLLLVANVLRQFYDFSEEESSLSWISGLQYRFRGLPRYIIISTLQSCVIYYGLCGFLQWYFYVRQRDRPEEWKCQPKKFLSWEDEKHSILLGSACMMFGSVISGFISSWTMNGGYTSLYYNVQDYGVLYLLISIPLTWLFMEALFYYYHRMFHFPYIYKNFHKIHHRYKQPTAFSASAMHPLEFVVLESALFIPMFVIPVHYAVYIVLVLYEYYYSVIGHSGIKMEAMWPWQANSMFHDNHHEYFHVNFGLNVKLYDYLHGTLRKKDRIYSEDIFYGYGKNWKEATEEERKQFRENHET